MLAEPRRKIRYSLNPNGLEWREDSTANVGKKLLSQMGWSEGAGLGANEQGMTAPIQLSLKNDLKGVGFKDLSPGEMLNAKMNPFHDVLGHLKQCQKQESGDSSGSSSSDSDDGASDAHDSAVLLKKAPSYSRVRHHRRIQVKDLSRRSQDEMRCIVGTAVVAQPPLKQESKKRKLKTEETVSAVEESTPSNKDHGVTTHVNKLSMADYFKEKMAAMKSKLSSVAQNPEDEEVPVKRIKQEKKVKFEDEVSVEVFETDATLYDYDNKEQSTSDVVMEDAYESFVEELKPKKKKAKKAKLQDAVNSDDTAVPTLAEPPLEELQTEASLFENKGETYVEDLKPKKKKTKKAKQQGDVTTDNTAVPILTDQPQEEWETSDVVMEDVNGSSVEDLKLKKKAKRAKQRNEVVTDNTAVPTFGEQLQKELEAEASLHEIKREPTSCVVIGDMDESSVEDLKMKKKKKAKKATQQDDTAVTTLLEPPEGEFRDAVSSKKKNKKKKVKQEDDTVDRIPADVIFSSSAVHSIPGYRYY